MAKKNNKYIAKRRRKIRIFKIILLIFVLAIGIIMFVVKSKYFIIKKVAILGNPIMSGEEVKSKTEYLVGQNILFIDKSLIVSKSKSNPYVKEVKIKKIYPKQVNITVTEKKAVYYIQAGKKNCVLSDKLIVLEEDSNIKNRNLVRLLGINIDNEVLGQEAIKNHRVVNILNLYSKMIDVNPTDFKIDCIDLSDLMNIRIYVGQVEGRLGNDENLTDKMNKFMHIIEDPKIGIKKGYVDVDLMEIRYIIRNKV